MPLISRVFGPYCKLPTEFFPSIYGLRANSSIVIFLRVSDEIMISSTGISHGASIFFNSSVGISKGLRLTLLLKDYKKGTSSMVGVDVY